MTAETATAAVDRETILSALRVWINQRPGASLRDYAHDWRDANGIAAYRSDMSTIQRQRRDALAMLKAIDWRDGITGDDIASAVRDAHSGRLTWDNERERLDYTAGQCWWMEYRAAACAGLAMVLWRRWREGAKDADAIRARARVELGRGIASRWFN